jgi:hypothetical protein
MNHMLHIATARQADLRAEAAQRRQSAAATATRDSSGSIIAIVRQALRGLGTEPGSVVSAAN